MRLINALGSGEGASAEQQSDMLLALNAMLDSWNTERLVIFSVERQTFTLTAGLNPHTIGPTGNIAVARPVKIDHASIIDNNLEYPMEQLNLARYQALPDKNTQSTIPDSYWYDPRLDGSGRARLYLWQVPSTANTIALYLWTPLSAAMTWAASVSFPPGYERAIVYNLALEIAPELARNPSEAVVHTAIESKAAIKSINIQPNYVEIDEMVLMGRGNRGHYNVYTGYYE